MPDFEFDVASALLDCLQEQFPSTVLATPNNFCLIPGAQIAEDVDPMTGLDLCCDGLGWVRMGDGYPSSNFPEPDPLASQCFPLKWAQPYEVGLLGCYPADTSMLTCEQKTALAVEDMERVKILKQVVCCFKRHVDRTWPGRLWSVGAIAVEGPRGGCISRVMQLNVQLPNCCSR